MKMRAKNERRQAPRAKAKKVDLIYRTSHGRMLVGRIEDALAGATLDSVRGKVNLIFTSPPFPLVYKKKYGNETGDTYLKWLKGLAPQLSESS